MPLNSPTPSCAGSKKFAAFSKLERGVYAALETYSNVHRGSGQFSQVSTALFERAREIILERAGVSSDRHTVIFCTPARAKALSEVLKPACYRVFSSQEIGLPLGMRALVVQRAALPKGIPLETGGGTIRLVSPDSVVWAGAPDRFEAGTPAVLNAIAFACALQLDQRSVDSNLFKISDSGISPSISPSQILDPEDYAPQSSGIRLLEQLREDCVGRRCVVPADSGERPYINLDNAASTPSFSAVWQAVRQTWRLPEKDWPELVQKVKHLCAEFFEAPYPLYETVFTSNTTEAINLAARVLRTVFARDASTRPVVLNTLLEHHSNELPWRALPGADHIRLAVDDEGFLDLDELEQTLRDYNQNAAHGPRRVRLVAICGASNVLGSVNNLPQISKIAHRYGALLLVDAAQLAAHRAIYSARWGIDLLALSAHKMYAPFGSGALILRRELLENFPAEQLENMQASGEENVTGIAAFGKAIQLLQRVGMETIRTVEDHLTARALRELAALPGVEVYGVTDPASPNFARRGGVISFRLEEVPYNVTARLLAEYGGIGVRTGCFCAHLISKRVMRIHPAREALANFGAVCLPGFTMQVVPGLVRVSFGIENSFEDIDCLVAVLQRILSEPRSLLARLAASTCNGLPGSPESETSRRIWRFVEAAARNVFQE